MSEDDNIIPMTEEERAKKLSEIMGKTRKLSEGEFRDAVVIDYNQLMILHAMANRNFEAIQKWMRMIDERIKMVDERTKMVEEKLSGLEIIAANDDPRRKTDHYLK